MSSKEELSNQIDKLKTDIQNLIDYKKTNLSTISREELISIDNVKKEKIESVTNYTNLLKEIIKKEKQKNTLLNNVKKAQNINDSINYHYAKKYNNSEELENLKKNKEIRENVRQEFLHYMNLDELFHNFDPSNLPGILFLHPDIIEKYGMCPYILPEEDLNSIISNSEIDIKFEEIKINLEAKRKEWLNNREDNGKLYYSLFENIFKEKEIINLKNNISFTEKQINEIITHQLSKSQINIYTKCLEMINEYSTCLIKTKKIKEKYKFIIHNLSILFSETSLSIHKFLEVKYSLNLPINSISSNNNCDNINQSKHNNIFIINQFEHNILEYQKYLNLIQQKTKYTLNIKKNLKQDFHDLLMKKSTTKFISSTSLDTKHNIQEGKYFKIWSNLSLDEKIERLESFSRYHVNELFKNNNSLLENQLNKLLKENLESKNLRCKDLDWKSDKGIIQKVKILKYDTETQMFYLDRTMPESKLQKSLSKKSIINKNNEKTINEEMLKFILKYKQKTNDSSFNISEHSDDFIDKLKNKLKFKKISKEDRIEIISKLINMQNIVQHNPSI
jgi:hypothetical protein